MSNTDYEASSAQMVKAEQDFLKAGPWRRELAGKTGDWRGIALSGGGIRSSTFCLGALQALAAHDLIKAFDYLSTVSGGGYIGCSLQWWWNKYPNLYSSSPDTFPYGSTDPRQIGGRSQNLAFLRNNGEYLAPGSGLALWTAIAVVIRSIFLNLVVWIPLIAALQAGVIWASQWLVGLPFFQGDWFGYVHGQPIWKGNEQAGVLDSTVPAVYVIALYLAYFLLGILALLSLVFSFLSRLEGERWKNFWIAFGLIGFTAAAVSFIKLFELIHITGATGLPAPAAILCLTGLSGLTLAVRGGIELLRNAETSAGYSARRALEWVGGRLARPIVLLLIFASVPFAYILAKDFQGPVGLFGLASGIGSALYGHYSSLRNWAPSVVTSVFASIGAALFLYGVIFVCYYLAVNYFIHELSYYGGMAVVIMLFISLLSLYVVNVNHIGLHRFYRDRLMEAFMPPHEAVATETVVSSPVADTLAVSKLAPAANLEGTIPFPIINTNAILIRDADRTRATRGGASFAITPLYSGSEATGWIRTDKYADGQGAISLATAMAVSGAAANANAGYVGTGLTRNPLISLLMQLTNVRLGLWLSNPKRSKHRAPRHIHPGLTYSLLGVGYSSDSHFLELSDGGHFDNLGVYELVRRQTKLILVCDGEADKEISYAGLVSVARRIAEDFGARVEFAPGLGPERLTPTDDMGYPSGVKGAKWPYLLARIDYGGGQFGLVLYIKATMNPDLSFISKGYKGKNPDFPHQTTADQFFEAEQFEAYRELGYLSAERLIADMELSGGIPDNDVIWRRYLDQLSGSSNDKKGKKNKV